MDNIGISVIVPFLNEEDGIRTFCDKIDNYFSTLPFDVELVFVNDGSTDNSAKIIDGFNFYNTKKVQLINLSKNYGSHSAIRAGIQSATYPICTWIGSDLQEPLELIPMAYSKIVNDKLDAVYIDKKTVGVSSVNRFFSKTYSKLMQKYAVKSYSSGGISTIVFNSKIKNYLNANIESNSSIMLQIMDSGFKYETVSLDFNERFAGVSKWTLSKKIKLLIDSFVAFSFMPIRLVSIIGFIIFIIGIIVGIVTFINKLTNPLVPIGYSTLAAIMALGFGITNISIGIIAEYLWRTYDAARNRPAFIVSEIKKIK